MSSTKGGQAHEATVNVHDLRIRDLVDLVAAQVSSAEDSIQQMYAWHFERSMSAARILGGTGGVYSYRNDCRRPEQGG